MHSLLKMDLNFQLYPELYLFQDPPIRADIPIFNLIMFVILSVSLVTLFTLVLQAWLDEEIRLLKEQFEEEMRGLKIRTTAVKHIIIPARLSDPDYK